MEEIHVKRCTKALHVYYTYRLGRGNRQKVIQNYTVFKGDGGKENVKSEQWME